MKHILNNLTEEEKNAIREQHTGGMKVMTENFSKLTNSKLGDVKLINEQPIPTKPSALATSMSKPIVGMLPQIKACVAQGGYPKLTEFLKKQETKQLDNIVIDMLMTFSVKKDPQASSEIGKLIECLQKSSSPTNQNKGINEQMQGRFPSAKPTSPSPITSPKPGAGGNYQIVPCSKLGIKSLGSCDSKTKRPVDYCSALGVKTPGVCYMDTKQPMTSTGGTMQNEQVMQALKNVAMKGMDYAKKGLNIIQGKTGNKFFDAAIGAKLGKMQDGKSSNEKVFCMDDSCEDSVRVFSDGRIVFERAEFGTKDKGKMVLNSDNSFVIKFNDGTSSDKFMPK